jgi:ATP-binding cassette subfamily B protein
MDEDLILVLEHGRITQMGTHTQMMHQPGMYRRIYDLQSRIEEELQADLAAVTAVPVNGHGKMAFRQLPQAGD